MANNILSFRAKRKKQYQVLIITRPHSSECLTIEKLHKEVALERIFISLWLYIHIDLKLNEDHQIFHVKSVDVCFIGYGGGGGGRRNDCKG